VSTDAESKLFRRDSRATKAGRKPGQIDVVDCRTLEPREQVETEEGRTRPPSTAIGNACTSSCRRAAAQRPSEEVKAHA
jgi:hypothetical protein